MTLEASHLESKEQFQEVISCVRNVREAWVVVARDPEAGRVLPRELRTREEKFLPGARFLWLLVRLVLRGGRLMQRYGSCLGLASVV